MPEGSERPVEACPIWLDVEISTIRTSLFTGCVQVHGGLDSKY